jgi:hypothetical protein
MLSNEHLPATVGACLASNHTLFHIANLVAFGSTSFADFRTNLMKTGQEMRAGELKIS